MTSCLDPAIESLRSDADAGRILLPLADSDRDFLISSVTAVIIVPGSSRALRLLLLMHGSIPWLAHMSVVWRRLP